MTCIVGVSQDGYVTMGADSMVATGYQEHTSRDGKIWRSGPWVVGAAGSLASVEVVRYAVELEEPGWDVHRYLVMEALPKIREGLAGHGLLRKKEEVQTGDAWLLCAYRDQLYCVDGYGSVLAVSDPYLTSGCGEFYARGALVALEAFPGFSPLDRVRRALRAAARCSIGVAAPFRILSTSPEHQETWPGGEVFP